MIEIGSFASEQLKRTDLSEAERRAVENVVASANPFHKEDCKYILSKELLTLLLEGKIRRESLTIGGKDAGKLEKELLGNKVQMNPNGSLYMLKSKEFTTLKYPEEIDLFLLTLKDMGLSGYPTTRQINERKDALGLDFCPAEVGPRYRLKYTNQPLNEWRVIWHEPIPDSDGRPSVFGLGRDGDGLWLGGNWANPGNQWFPGYVFAFSLRKLDS